jgi:hypothetical protein
MRNRLKRGPDAVTRQDAGHDEKSIPTDLSDAE